MANVITRNGANLSYQPAKVISIPISEIYNSVENDQVFLFALTYARHGKTILFDVRRPNDGSEFVNEYHMHDDISNYVYYEVTSDYINVYVNLMLNTRASITCLNDGENPLIIYHDYQKADSRSLTPSKILGFGDKIKLTTTYKTTVKFSNVENLYVTRFNVNSDNEEIRLDVSDFIGSQTISGFVKVVNITAAVDPRYKEFVITDGSVKSISDSTANINVTVDSSNKIITFSNLARGGLVVQYIPMYKLS